MKNNMELTKAIKVLKEKQKENKPIMKYTAKSKAIELMQEDYKAIETLLKYAEESEKIIKDMQEGIENLQDQLWHRG